MHVQYVRIYFIEHRRAYYLRLSLCMYLCIYVVQYHVCVYVCMYVCM